MQTRQNLSYSLDSSMAKLPLSEQQHNTIRIAFSTAVKLFRTPLPKHANSRTLIESSSGALSHTQGVKAILLDHVCHLAHLWLPSSAEAAEEAP